MNSTSLDAGQPVGTEAAVDAGKRKRNGSLADRTLLVLGVSGVALAFLTFYGIQAWLRKTPWVLTDELEWSQISRAIEETGHSARRGEPIFFKTLYAVVIAPFWAISDTHTAYSAIKYANVVIMTLAAVPTYLLARMLMPKRPAFVVAVLSICIPGMAYVTTLVPEVLAYPWYALCSWLIVRALVRRGRLDYLWAVLASVVAMLVRSPQFATVFASFVIAAAILWVAGPSGQAFRRNHTLGEKIGVVVLLIGGLILFNRIVLQQVEAWQLSTQYWKHRMVDLGLRAGLAFTVGMGVLPVIGGLASLRIVERRADPVYRAFAAYLAATIFSVSLYTGVKAAFLSTNFATLTEERNLIYLSPLMLIGSALVLEAKRIDWRIVAVASAFVLFLIWEKQMEINLFPYFEAPGFAILTIPNREWFWNEQDLRWALVGVLILSLLILAFRRAPGMLAVAAVLSCAWMLTSEIQTTIGFTHFADQIRGKLPTQLDWVDRATHGEQVVYLGQVGHNFDPNTLQLTEFWNRSLQRVYSLDGLAPGPGPTATPDIVSAEGTLTRLPPGTRYVLADTGVFLQAREIHREGDLKLYEKQGPWRLLDATQQVATDGWATYWSTWTYFKPGQHGTVEVTLSRTAYNGDAPPGHAKVEVSTVAFNAKRGGPVQGDVYATERRIIRNGEEVKLTFPVEQTPVRVEIRTAPWFRASVADPRKLTAVVGFKFIPAED